MQAGKIMLLAIVFLLSSKATLHAQGQTLIPTMTVKNDRSCTALQSVLVASEGTCVAKKLTQKELAVKAAVLEDDETKLPDFTYAAEPVYYVEPTPTPTTTTQATVTPTPHQSNLLEGARDMVPQTGIQVDSNIIFDLINAHRLSIGKPSFQKDEALCSLAQTRSMELSSEFANGTLHSGLYNRGLPYWITEDAKWGSNEAGTVRWWLNSPIHRKAIEGDYTHSCGACNGSQCSQLFTSYTPKQTATQTSTFPVASQE